MRFCKIEMTFIDKLRQEICKENTRSELEWSSFALPPWDDMTEEQRSKAVELAEIQGKRLATIHARYEREVGHGQ